MSSSSQPTLSERLEPSGALRQLMGELGAALRADFAGIALRRRSQDRYRVIGAVDRRREGPRKSNRDFAVSETVGSWVEQTSLPFIGSRPDDVRRFRQTATDMAIHGFSSNVVLPLVVGPEVGAILYCLSSVPHAFSPDSLAVLARVQRVLEPLTAAWLAATDLEEGQEPSRPPARVPDGDPDLTLAAFERQHILAVLARTNGVIEGPRGAAMRLGIKPSTLRSRLRKLGLR
jgi:hypothetical protein